MMTCRVTAQVTLSIRQASIINQTISWKLEKTSRAPSKSCTLLEDNFTLVLIVFQPIGLVLFLIGFFFNISLYRLGLVEFRLVWFWVLFCFVVFDFVWVILVWLRVSQCCMLVYGTWDAPPLQISPTYMVVCRTQLCEALLLLLAVFQGVSHH